MSDSKIMVALIVGITLAVLATAAKAAETHLVQLEWIRTYNGPASRSDQGYGVAVNTAGDIYVSGYETTPNSNNLSGYGSYVWLRKYSAGGSVLWTSTIGSPYRYPGRSHDVTVDSSGNAYVTGYDFTVPGQGANILIQKFYANGNPSWSYSVNSGYHSGDGGKGITIDSVGNIYVTGHEANPGLGQGDNIWLRKYNKNGNTMWTKTYDGSTHGNDYGEDVAIDALGNIYVTGSSAGDIWLRKFDTNGNVLWTETYDSPAHSSDEGFGVTVDVAGNIYVTGWEYRGDLHQDSNIILLKYSQTVIPEPCTLLLLAPALLGFAGIVLKRRK